jgi:hypothetical protein
MTIKPLADAAIDWLYPGDSKAYHNKLSRERVPASGSWFLESDSFFVGKDAIARSGVVRPGHRLMPWQGLQRAAMLVMFTTPTSDSARAYQDYSQW